MKALVKNATDAHPNISLLPVDELRDLASGLPAGDAELVGVAIKLWERREAATEKMMKALKDEIEGKTSRLPDNPQLYRVGRVDGTREMVVRPSNGPKHDREYGYSVEIGE